MKIHVNRSFSFWRVIWNFYNNEYLVQYGADIDKPDNGGLLFFFLIVSCIKGFRNIIKCLLEYGADINKQNNDGLTLLFIACEKGNENMVKYLMEHGADINK